MGDTLKVKVMAPPEKGKANKAMVELLATRLNIDSRCINITGGLTSPNKTVRIDGFTETGIKTALKA